MSGMNGMSFDTMDRLETIGDIKIARFELKSKVMRGLVHMRQGKQSVVLTSLVIL